MTFLLYQLFRKFKRFLIISITFCLSHTAYSQGFGRDFVKLNQRLGTEIAKAQSNDSIAFRYASQISADDIKSSIYVLSSDSLEGRETGKPGQKKAARFIANYFQQLNLKPIAHGTYYQETSLSTKANYGKNFLINERFYLFMHDYFYPPGIPDSTYKLDSISFVGYGIRNDNYDDYKEMNVEGKAVLFFEGQPSGKKGKPLNIKYVDLKTKLGIAEEKGASLAIIITDSLEQIIDSYRKMELGDSTIQLPASNPKLPFVFIERVSSRSFFPEFDDVIAERAKARIDRKKKPRSFMSVTNGLLPFVKNTDSQRGENVIGLLEGTDKKDEVIVMSAHYDHLGKKDSLIYYGADDDGSGTAAIMELARQFSKAAAEGHRPRRSILFITFAGEEKGLIGSKYYVAHPLVPLEKTVTNLNIDMIGRTDEKHDSLGVRNYVYIIGSDKHSTELHRINEHNDSVYTHLDLDYTYNQADDPNRFYYRSDHYNFAKNKIPIIFYFNGVHKDYHKPTDTIDKIQFDLLVKRAQLVFLTAWQLANREERVKMDVKQKKEE